MNNPDDLLTVAEAAALAEIAPSTWRAQVSRGAAPAPDDPDDGSPPSRRRPRWRRDTVTTHLANRPGQGRRTPTSTVAEVLADFAQYGALVQYQAQTKRLRLLVITDPEHMILEGQCVPVEIDDPDGTLFRQAGQALTQARIHRGRDEDAPRATVAEMLGASRRELPPPTFDPMDV